MNSKSSQPPIRLCVLGSTGTGKSALCNILSNCLSFPESSELHSCTYATTSNRYFDNVFGCEFEIIDTPGLGDSAGSKKDTENIANMVRFLKDKQKINAFCIVFNGQNPRFDDHLKGVLKIFEEIFGADFMKNSILIFTHWTFDKRTKLSRKLNHDGEIEKEEKFNVLFKNHFKMNKIRLPCAFLDCTYNHEEIKQASTDEELSEFSENILKIKDFAFSKRLDPFVCLDIKEVVAEKERFRMRQAQLENENRIKESKLLEEMKVRQKEAEAYEMQLRKKEEQNKQRMKEQQMEYEKQQRAQREELERQKAEALRQKEREYEMEKERLRKKNEEEENKKRAQAQSNFLQQLMFMQMLQGGQCYSSGRRHRGVYFLG